MQSKSSLSRTLLQLDRWVESHVVLVSVGVYAVALVLRALYLLDFRGTLLASVLMMDEAYYHAEAWNLIQGVPNSTDSASKKFSANSAAMR